MWWKLAETALLLKTDDAAADAAAKTGAETGRAVHIPSPHGKQRWQKKAIWKMNDG